MDMTEIRKFNLDELLSKLKETRREHMDLRFKKASMQLSDTTQIKKIKRDIARLETRLTELIVSVSSRAKTRYKGKTIKRSKKYIVHDPDNNAKEGDTVQITNSRPISKLKRWRLYKIQEINDNIPLSLDKEDS